MRMTLQTHGGLAAIRRKPVSLDTGSLEPGQAKSVENLVRTLLATASAPSGEPLPDAMSYTLTVEDDGKTAVVKQRDGGITPEFERLLDQFATHGGPAAG
jgi:hypothetical protein